MTQNRSRSLHALTIVGLAALVLSGCTTGTAETPPATPTTAATSEAPVLEELHQQYLAAGLPCDWRVTENLMSGSLASGGCHDSENNISTFTTQADVDALLALNTNSIEPGLFLVGDRWVVGSEDPADLMSAQATMGGDLWPADSDFYAVN